MLKELDTQFVRNGYLYSQLYKDEYVVVYFVTDAKRDIYFEVFKPKIQKLYPHYSTKKLIAEGYTDMELYPTVSSFGSWAWCCRSKSSVQNVINRHFENMPNLQSLLRKISIFSGE